MAVHRLVLLHIILLLWGIEASELRCQKKCGDVNVSYPFGIGEDCYFEKSFQVICDNSSGSPKAVLNSIKIELSSDMYLGSLIGVNIPVISLKSSESTSNIGKGLNLSGSPFSFSQRNTFTAIGCDNVVTINNLGSNNDDEGCLSVCTCDPTQSQYAGCCDIICTIPPNSKVFDANMAHNYSQSITQKCTSLMMVDEYWLLSKYQTNFSVLKDEEQVPGVREWGKIKGTCLGDFNSANGSCNLDKYCLMQLDSGHLCLCHDARFSSDQDLCKGSLICNTTSGYNCFQSQCPHGYSLDPSDSDQEPQCSPSSTFDSSRVKFIVIGCTSGGIGTLFLIIGALRLYKFVKRRRKTKLKQKFFKRNGGLLLQQDSSSNDGNIYKTKNFTSKELERATDFFNENRILGQGGQGTVYKGMLADGRIVAVKKSQVVDESKVEEFINEVVILSQINHRNVVKLLGCCLETQVPLLVYEFISNGTLFEHIHDHENHEFPITWEMRLRIAAEVSGALSYLHSASSVPIYHRDIKSTNILLDDKYSAKVSDFGTSRSISIDQTHMTTLVQGTFGYLDPEYFRSSQFTDKSDVYSFGVVLAELLTGEKPIRSINSEEDRNLAANFLSAMKENCLFEILDARVLKDGGKNEIITVAKLAKRCLNLNRKKRPTMIEVATELAGIRGGIGASILQESLEEEIQCVDAYATSRHFEIDSSFIGSGSFFDSTTFSVEVDPLISNKW